VRHQGRVRDGRGQGHAALRQHRAAQEHEGEGCRGAETGTEGQRGVQRGRGSGGCREAQGCRGRDAEVADFCVHRSSPTPPMRRPSPHPRPHLCLPSCSFFNRSLVPPQLYANVVHSFNIPGIKSRHDGVDVVIVRENTEVRASSRCAPCADGCAPCVARYAVCWRLCAVLMVGRCADGCALCGVRYALCVARDVRCALCARPLVRPPAACNTKHDSQAPHAIPQRPPSRATRTLETMRCSQYLGPRCPPVLCFHHSRLILCPASPSPVPAGRVQRHGA